MCWRVGSGGGRRGPRRWSSNRHLQDFTGFAGIATDGFMAAMNAEGIPNQASYPPLHQLHMFRNGEYRKRLCGKQAKERHAFLKRRFPATQRAAWETIWMPQPALLGD